MWVLDPILQVYSCNAPDTTLHICNSNPCHFRLCDILFSSVVGFFVFCFAFCSCHAFHLMSSCALHPHVFIKLAPVFSCRFSPLSSLTAPSQTTLLHTIALSLYTTTTLLAASETCPEPEPLGHDQQVRIILKHPLNIIVYLLYSPSLFFSTARFRSEGPNLP